MPTNTDERFSFQFPRARFADENNIHGQVAHIVTEADEAFRELNNPDVFTLAAEIMDTKHSCETALRILSERHGVNLENLRTYVEEKNRIRGYYA